MKNSMESNIESLLKLEPYSLSKSEKDEIFYNAMNESVKFHYEKSEEFRKLCDNRNFSPDKEFLIQEIPFLPVSLFKTFQLKSVPDSDIIKTVYSSATTSNSPSTIFLDQTTSKRQTKVLVSIMKDFLINKKKFLIIDQKSDLNNSTEVKSRESAIRGFFPFMESMNFGLDSKLKLDISLFEELKNNDVCVMGFTWLLYTTVIENENNDAIKKFFKTIKNPKIIHIGGWKKLSDKKVSKEEFNQRISEFFNCEKENIIDIYGMTEQLGTIYPDCAEGNKHVSVFSEIFIRNIQTLEIEDIGKSGFIQLVSPIPHSYPGVSLLSDDIGKIIGVDNCPCGRKGKYFRFEKRTEQADIKGCGDTID